MNKRYSETKKASKGNAFDWKHWKSTVTAQEIQTGKPPRAQNLDTLNCGQFVIAYSKARASHG